MMSCLTRSLFVVLILMVMISVSLTLKDDQVEKKDKADNTTDIEVEDLIIRRNKRQLEEIGMVLEVAKGVGELVKLFIDLVTKEPASVLIYVDNYTNVTLVSGAVYINRGTEMDQAQKSIRPGVREAFLAIQEKHADSVFCGGVLFWHLPNDNRVSVGWKAAKEQKSIDRKPNSLSVGITTATSMLDPMFSANSSYAVYDRSLQTIEYIGDDYFVQGTMGSTHHAEVQISVYPIKWEGLAAKIKPELDQEELNRIRKSAKVIKQANTSSVMHGSIFLFISVLLLIV